MNILAIIPARGGSKGIPRKNIQLVAGKPLISYSIEYGLRLPSVTRVIVSTDDKEIADIAHEYGAEVPFIRPHEFAGDLSPDIDVFTHALNWLKENESYKPDILLHLRPTHPIRNIRDGENILQILISNPRIDSVRSISIAPETPFKMWFRNEKGLLTPIVTDDRIVEAHSMPRQFLPKVYLQNAAIDAIRSQVIIRQQSITGKNIYGYLIDDNYDIDTQEQLSFVDAYVSQRGGKLWD